jgi:hypothetical protein
MRGPPRSRGRTRVPVIPVELVPTRAGGDMSQDGEIVLHGNCRTSGATFL